MKTLVRNRLGDEKKRNEGQKHPRAGRKNSRNYGPSMTRWARKESWNPGNRPEKGGREWLFRRKMEGK